MHIFDQWLPTDISVRWLPTEIWQIWHNRALLTCFCHQPPEIVLWLLFDARHTKSWMNSSKFACCPTSYFLSVWNCWCYCPVASIRFEYWHLTQEVQHIGRPNHSWQIQTPVDWRPSYAALSLCVWCLKHALGSGVTARVNYYCWYAIPPHYPGELRAMYTMTLCYGTVTRVEW